MKNIPQSEIPALPVQDVINGECVAFGVGEQGVMIQFMERDKCILIEWPDVIMYGIEILKHEDQKPEPEAEEIEKPTEVS